MSEILHNNQELKTGLKNALKSGYFGHMYSASIHVSTMVPKNSTLMMSDILQKNEALHSKISEYMKQWLIK